MFKRLAADHALPFLDGQNLICSEVIRSIDRTTRPLDFEPFCKGSLPHSKMDAKVVLTEIAGSRLDVPAQNPAADRES